MGDLDHPSPLAQSCCYVLLLCKISAVFATNPYGHLMVFHRILLTSFAPWKAHQIANSSDQLLGSLAERSPWREQLHFLRYLPVNLPVARDLVLSKIHQLQPDLLICCGMAELRPQLQLEAQATRSETTLQTRLNLIQLVQGLDHTTISQDAGRFVCNSLYYAILDHLQATFPKQDSSMRDCLFVHVPLLTSQNREPILSDFCLLIQKLLAPESSPLSSHLRELADRSSL